MTQSQDVLARTGEILTAHEGVEGPLLPVLHAIQHQFGHIPAETVPLIAERLNLSKAEVSGVITFYHDFRQQPAGRHVVRLCRAEACQAMGAERLAEQARARLGVDWHGTSADGRVTLEPVFCLGLCACGPAMMVDGRPIARLDEARLDAALKEVMA